MAGLRQRLSSGDVVCGVEVGMASTASVEMLGGLDFDLLVIDTRHAPASAYNGELETLVRAADTTATPTLARIPTNSPGTVNRALNDGAGGIYVAVDHPDDARRAVESARYPPQGRRGAAPMVRAARFGLTQWDEYLDMTNHDKAMAVGIETAEGLEAAGEIAAVDGVDVVVFQVLSLATLLTTGGRTDAGALLSHSDVRGAVDVAVGHTSIGVDLVGTSGAPAWHDAGATFFVVGNDLGAYAGAALAMRTSLDALPQTLSEAGA